MCHETDQSAFLHTHTHTHTHSCIYLRILIISYLATFLGANCLSAAMCRKAVNQPTIPHINHSLQSYAARMYALPPPIPDDPFLGPRIVSSSCTGLHDVRDVLDLVSLEIREFHIQLISRTRARDVTPRAHDPSARLVGRPSEYRPCLSRTRTAPTPVDSRRPRIVRFGVTKRRCQRQSKVVVVVVCQTES